MRTPDLENDYPITKRNGIKRYVFGGKHFFTRKGAENSRAEYIIVYYTEKNRQIAKRGR